MTGYHRKVAALRKEWAAETNPCCMVCCTDCDDLDVHEMVYRSRAPGQWGIRSNLLKVCRRRCHEMIHRINAPLSWQLAVKLLRDPDNFNLDEINEITPSGPVRMSEVLYWIKTTLRNPC